MRDAPHERSGGGLAPLAELQQVDRRFEHDDVVALENVSLAIAPGEWAAVVGPSGSGKTTLLYMLSGLDRPTRGRVLFDGSEPCSPAEWSSIRSRRIGFVFQAFHLLPALTAEENVEVPMFGLVPRAPERRARARELLAIVGLDHRASHPARHLSAGEQQRVAIARSLANLPDMVLADEPTGNLDRAASEQILAMLGSLRRRRQLALVVVTHSPAVAARAERVLHLDKGRLEPAGEAP